MKLRSLALLACLFFAAESFAQQGEGHVIYIVDSIPVIETPLEGIELSPDAVAEIVVVKNKDSLTAYGYGRFDGAIFIFTKSYRTRSEALRQIPSTKQMVRKDGVWHFRNFPYSGPFIDYYFDGRKEGEGQFIAGKVDGKRTTYYPNGQRSLERIYEKGTANGTSKEFFEDGTLRQQGVFANGKEEGVWTLYFPNGQVMQRSQFRNGQMEGETIVYYSTGKIKAIELTQNGKTAPDKRYDKLDKHMDRGHAYSRMGDYKAAIKSYTKTIEMDSTYADAYFARATARLNDFQFDAALSDFDSALAYEPFMKEALSNRAFCLIRKHQFGSSRKLGGNNEVTILAAKDNVAIPAKDLNTICSDLQKAKFLGDHSAMVTEALAQYCNK